MCVYVGPLLVRPLVCYVYALRWRIIPYTKFRKCFARLIFSRPNTMRLLCIPETKQMFNVPGIAADIRRSVRVLFLLCSNLRLLCVSSAILYFTILYHAIPYHTIPHHTKRNVKFLLAYPYY